MKKNYQNIWCISSILFVIVLIFITTIWNAGLDVTKWKEKEFLSNLTINCAISLFGIFSAMGLADNHYRTKENGMLDVTYKNFCTAKNKIEEHLDKFPYWIRRLHRKETEDKCIRYLKDQNGITQAKLILKHLDIIDVESLNKPFSKVLDNGKQIFFKSLTNEQILALKEVMQGKIKVEYLHETYFLNAYNKSNAKSMYEQASKESAVRNQRSFVLVLYRILLTIAMGLIFAGLTVEGIDSNKVGQILINIFSRLSILASSIYSGFTIAHILVKYDCQFIEYKTNVLETFNLEVIINKTVVCLTEEEEAEQEYYEVTNE